MPIFTRKPIDTAEIYRNAKAWLNVKGACTTRNAMTGQRIQRGTKRPPGNKARMSGNKVAKRKLKHSFGNCKGEGLADTLNITLKGLSVTRKSATMNAMRSSGLRQTITILTARHTTNRINVSVTENTMKTPGKRPIPSSDPACSGLSCR